MSLYLHSSWNALSWDCRHVLHDGRPIAQVASLELSNNDLIGPAFPETWLVAGAMPRLALLDVSGNKDVGGALPEDLLLRWPKIGELRLGGTSLPGAVPRQWQDSTPVSSANSSKREFMLIKV